MNFLRKHGGWVVIALIFAATLYVTQTVNAKDVREWSTTAGSNNDASPDGFPEGMAPSGVNNSARELMAAVAEVYATTYGRNILINGDFRVFQRGTSFTSTTTPANNDDTYLADRWVLLADGNDTVDVSQETSTVPTGSYAAIKLDVETGNRKFGIVQFVEARDAKALIGGTGSLSFKARITGTTINAIRAGAACWSSTADSVTSDIVSAWGAAGTNPTLVANWTFENTPADLTAPTTSYQTYRIENISFDTASCTNIAVFIWTDDVTTTVGEFLYIADVQLEPGPVATNFERIPFSEQMVRAQRFWQQSYNVGVAPGTVTSAGQFAITDPVAQGLWWVPFRVSLRTTPTMTIYSPATGTSGVYRDGTSGADIAADSANIGHNSFSPYAATTHGAADEAISLHWTADAEL